MLKTRTTPVAVALCGLLIGCGPSGAPEGEGRASQEQAPAPTPVLPHDASPETTPIAAPAQPVEAGVWSGDELTIRADTANLRVTNENRNFIALGMTITFENNSDQPVSLILARRGTPSVLLDNGLTLTPRRDAITVLGECWDELDQCRQSEREKFVQIDAGKSLSINATLSGEYPDGARADVQTVDSGTVTMRLHLLSADGLTRTLDVSLKDAAIQNRIS